MNYALLYNACIFATRIFYCSKDQIGDILHKSFDL